MIPCNPVEICPYGDVGDRLWVRETWYYEEHMPRFNGRNARFTRRLIFTQACLIKQRLPGPSLVNGGLGFPGKAGDPQSSCPCWASRITLKITGIRVERLQDISHEDAIAEGVYEYCLNCRKTLSV